MKKFITAACVFCLIILVLFSFYQSKYTLSLTTYRLTSSKLTEPLRLLHLTDLHNSTFGENNGELLSLAAQQSPDLILLTGDLLNSDEENVSTAVDFVKKVCEIAPVYLSFGNHELEYEQNYGTDLRALFEAAGGVVLDREYTDIEVRGQKLRIGGIYGYCLPAMYLRTGEADEEECAFLTDFQDTERCTVLLTHMPVCWMLNGGLEEWDVDYIFSGHVHGGQIILPGIGGLYGPDMGWFPGRLEGIYTSQDESSTLVLSRGLGSTGRLPRLNNLPELLVVDLQPQG